MAITVTRLALAVGLLAALPAVADAQVGSYEGLFGARLGGAQRQSIYVGVGHITHYSSEDHSAQTLELEMGRSAGQVGLGLSSQGQMTPIFRGQMVALRTWRRPSDLAANQTFVGTEVQISLLVGVSFGTYWRVRGNAPGDARYHAVRLVVGI
ncbi:MAG TPA: hypothetical protein VHM30_11745 [Gemmatimonadaceae bacterium]|nr:hypothetical protein [Gemmatimonadaceae bacterium]